MVPHMEAKWALLLNEVEESMAPALTDSAAKRAKLGVMYSGVK
jgi:hypothetical protein